MAAVLHFYGIDCDCHGDNSIASRVHTRRQSYRDTAPSIAQFMSEEQQHSLHIFEQDSFPARQDIVPAGGVNMSDSSTSPQEPSPREEQKPTILPERSIYTTSANQPLQSEGLKVPIQRTAVVRTRPWTMKIVCHHRKGRGKTVNEWCMNRIGKKNRLKQTVVDAKGQCGWFRERELQ